MRLVEEADFADLQTNRDELTRGAPETPEPGASQPQMKRAFASTSSSSTSVPTSTPPAGPSKEPVVDPLEKILDEFPFTANMPKRTPEERALRLEKYNCYPWMHPGYVPSPSRSPSPESTVPYQPSAATSTTLEDARSNTNNEPVRAHSKTGECMGVEGSAPLPASPRRSTPPPSSSQALVPVDHPCLENPRPIYSFQRCTSTREKEFYESIFPALRNSGLGPLFGALTSRLYIYEESCGFEVCPLSHFISPDPNFFCFIALH